MSRSLLLRLVVSLLICGLVGVGLAVSAAGAGRGTCRHDAVVTTRSEGVVAGAFRGHSADGIVLALGERVRVVPWDAVSGVSFRPSGELAEDEKAVVAVSGW